MKSLIYILIDGFEKSSTAMEENIVLCFKEYSAKMVARKLQFNCRKQFMVLKINLCNLTVTIILCPVTVLHTLLVFCIFVNKHFEHAKKE